MLYPSRRYFLFLFNRPHHPLSFSRYFSFSHLQHGPHLWIFWPCFLLKLNNDRCLSRWCPPATEPSSLASAASFGSLSSPIWRAGRAATRPPSLPSTEHTVRAAARWSFFSPQLYLSCSSYGVSFYFISISFVEGPRTKRTSAILFPMSPMSLSTFK